MSSSSTPGKERVVILGSGWAGYILSRKLSPKKYDITVVSPRSYFVFTPLLNDTAVGNLEFPYVVEPVRDRNLPVEFVQGWAREIDFQSRKLKVEGSITDGGVTEADVAVGGDDNGADGPTTRMASRKKEVEERKQNTKMVELDYDKLIVSVGCSAQTFGTKGVKENALFLKDVGDARKIRRRILECFELAAAPDTSPDMQKWLLHFAAVGGGPTGMEFAAVLADFIKEDLIKLYPSLKGIPKITVYDVAPKVLSMFDDALSRYAADTMKRQGVEVKTEHHIKELRWGQPNAKDTDADPRGCLTLDTEEQGQVGIGMCVWSTGNAINPLIGHAFNDTSAKSIPQTELKFKSAEKLSPDDPSSNSDSTSTTWQFHTSPSNNALLVDTHLRVQLVSHIPNNTSTGKEAPPTQQKASLPNIFALGDNAILETAPLPATAQSANQEAIWLAKTLNKMADQRMKTKTEVGIDSYPEFNFRDLGVMTYVGAQQGLVQAPNKGNGGEGEEKSLKDKILPDAITGKSAWLAWKGAYWSMSLSWRNRVLILVSWMVNWIFGRGVGRY